MKKMMLSLVVVVMMLAMVGCGTNNKKNNSTIEQTTENEISSNVSESEVETEVKVDINGNVITETEIESIEKTVYTMYGMVKKVDLTFKEVELEFYEEKGSGWGISIPYEDKFAESEGKVVKVTGYGDEHYLDEILTIEIVEE